MESRIRSRKRAQSTTTSSPPCATTSPAPVGATAMRYGPARPSVATALISTRCLSAWCGRVRNTCALRNWFFAACQQHDGAVAGYHCWAQFYVEPYGWIPVDASEAWKHPEKKSYLFGTHDDNRLQFTVGRDVRFDPPAGRSAQLLHLSVCGARRKAVRGGVQVLVPRSSEQ